METTKNKAWSIKRLVRTALFIALSGVGAWIVFPSPLGTVALDSAPGYFLVLAAGRLEGAFVLTLGHLISAFKMGFPLGPIHLAVAILMAGCGVVFYHLVQKTNLVISIGLTSLLNGVVINLVLIPLLGTGFFVAMTPTLLLASLVNISLAYGLYSILQDRLEERFK